MSCEAAPILAAGALAQEAISVNGSFDAGAAAWTLAGGASVVATGEPGDNPFGRVPDGGLVFRYQKLRSEAPQLALSFDFYTGLMASAFPSPGGFPNSAFASVYFGPTESGLHPEFLRSGASLALFDFDAVNGLSRLLAGAVLTSSPDRPGWTRFEGSFDRVAEQPFLAVTFQGFNANGVAGDSALLVDNLRVEVVPEPAVRTLLFAGLAAVVGCAPRRRAPNGEVGPG